MKRLLLTISVFAFSLSGFSQCGGFYDGFESGTTSPTWMGTGGTMTSAVVSAPSPVNVGNYALSTSGGSGHLMGIVANFPTITPSEISWYIYPNGGVANNYVVAGDATVSGTNCIMFVYWQGTTGNIRFVSSSILDYPATPNQWYHIEMKNIDYVNRIFDIYINGVLFYTAFPFRSATINTLSVMHLYNFAGGTAYYDEIVAGNVPISFDLVGTDVQCNGDMNGAIDATIFDAQGPVTYNWSNLEITEDISGLGGGTYTLTATDSAGCVAVDSLVISEPPALGASYDSLNPTTCQGVDGTIDLYVTGGVPGYIYNWNSGDTTASISGLGAGSYDVAVTDTNGCIAQWSFVLADPAPPVVSVSWSTQYTCTYYAPFTLTGGTPAGGTWSGTGVSGNDFDPSMASIGTNVLTYSFTDTLNCAGSATAEVMVDECLNLSEAGGLSVSVYPNPANAQVNIRTDYGTYSLRLIALSGQELTQARFTGTDYALSLDGYAPGLYHLEIASDSQQELVKLYVE